MPRKACILLVAFQLLLFAQSIVGAPIRLAHEELSDNNVDSVAKRTLFNIIIGCVSTTLICSWGAIHPNIPPREQPVKTLLRRFELMLWAIVSPEILPCWALNQLFAAMAVRDAYNEDGKSMSRNFRRDLTVILAPKGPTHCLAYRAWKTFIGWFSWHEIPDERSSSE